MTSSPWVAAVFAVFVLMAGVGMIHSVQYPSGSRDPIRRFNRADKAVILRRAGGRCEHHGWLFGRCKAMRGLEADHVHPHSRGGWTQLANGQALCRSHNSAITITDVLQPCQTSGHPVQLAARGLEKRRAGYFPPEVSGVVIRTAAHAKRASRTVVPS